MRSLPAAIAALLIAAWALPTLAADDPTATTDADRANLQSCIEAARDSGVAADQCIGAAADPCMEHPDFQSTMGMVACAMRETGFWDGQLNFVYGELRAALDRPAADELRDIQRLWIKWRDANCAFPVALYDGGTAMKPAIALCQMRETARRAIDLGAMLDEVAAR